MTDWTPFGLIIAEGHGAYAVDVERIEHGFKVKQTGDSGRTRRTNYVSRVSESEFSIQTAWTSYDRFNRFTKWLQDYANKAAEGTARAMRVVYPAREFDRTGVPQSITFGDASGRYVHRLTITFTASQNPLAVGAGFSQAFGTTVDPEVNYMLPYGFQLTAFDPGVYRPPAPPAVPVVAQPPIGEPPSGVEIPEGGIIGAL